MLARKWHSIVFGLVSIMATPVAIAQTTYPKLLMAGEGIGISRFNVTRRVGTSWGPVGRTFITGERYRVIVRVTNFRNPNITTSFNSAYIDRATSINVQFAFAGPPTPPATSPMMWYTSSRYSGSGQPGGFDRRDTKALLNGQSRAYTGYFIWTGVTAPFVAPEVTLSGSEQLVLLPNVQTLSPTP